MQVPGAWSQPSEPAGRLGARGKGGGATLGIRHSTQPTRGGKAACLGFEWRIPNVAVPLPFPGRPGTSQARMVESRRPGPAFILSRGGCRDVKLRGSGRQERGGGPRQGWLWRGRPGRQGRRRGNRSTHARRTAAGQRARPGGRHRAPRKIVTLASNVTISFWAFRTSFGTKNDQIVTLQRLYL